MRTIRALFQILALSLLPALPALAGTLSLAVAANFTSTARTLAERFEADTGHRVSISFGSTGKLYAQIRNGAPYDVFMAADAERPTRIEASPQGVPGTRFTYARGILVLWSPEPERFPAPEEYLQAASFSAWPWPIPSLRPMGWQPGRH